MKYLSVCSGIEAASKAWEPIGWEPVAFSEIEPFPSAVLKHHWPKVQNLGDMTQHEQWNIPSGTIDLLVGGTPCQSFSVAGLRQGLKDPRGNLMLTYLAIAERLKPRWLVWENVPGVLSSNGGKDFGSFLGALGELGYEWAYRVLDAQWFGVAQRRRRVFVVAHLGEGSLAAKVLFESESVRRNPAPSRETRQGVATNVAPSLTASNDPSRSPQSSEVTQQVNAVLEATTYRMQAFGEYSDDGTASAMKARDYKDATDLVAEPVAYNITFCDANGTRSDRPDGGLYVNKTDVTGSLTRAGIGTNVVQPVIAPVVIDRAAFNQGQNAQYKPHIEHSETMDSLVARGPHAVAFQTSELRLTGKLTEKSVCPTLKANTKAGDTEVKVVLYENHPNDSRVTGPHDVAPSCVSRYGTGGGNVPLVQEAIAFEPGIATREGSESRFVKELSPTLRKDMGDNQVAVSDSRMAVRRLSPRECERLQGFPDDHTLIPWRNKPVDQCPDGPRYKALGNSMAVPCMAWIGKRIDAVEKTK
jgi:DNA (cytosine-5)-methyltransferase 1